MCYKFRHQTCKGQRCRRNMLGSQDGAAIGLVACSCQIIEGVTLAT